MELWRYGAQPLNLSYITPLHLKGSSKKTNRKPERILHQHGYFRLFFLALPQRIAIVNACDLKLTKEFSSLITALK
jgi:hypothetical protein